MFAPSTPEPRAQDAEIIQSDERVLEVTGRHPRTLPVYANDHAADLVK
jgi:hypothetical protein